MQTDDLIRALASYVVPVSRSAIERRIALGIAGGAVVTLAGIAMMLGFRPDLGQAVQDYAFWMKCAYTSSIGLCAVLATVHLSRPDAVRTGWIWLLVVPAGLLAAVSVRELIHTPMAGWLSLWIGQSWKRCALYVLICALPIFAGLLWAFRQLAPTRLRLAGAMAGLASGACAATLYGLHCPESSAMFVLTWYSLGMGLAALVGAWAGPRFMRW